MSVQSVNYYVENEKIRALFGAGNYCLSLVYRKFWSTRWQAMCGTPGVRKGRRITLADLGNTYQVFPIHFVC